MTEYAKALDQDNLELRSVVGGSSDNHTSLSKIPETATSAISTNVTPLILEEILNTTGGLILSFYLYELVLLHPVFYFGDPAPVTQNSSSNPDAASPR